MLHPRGLSCDLDPIFWLHTFSGLRFKARLHVNHLKASARRVETVMPARANSLFDGSWGHKAGLVAEREQTCRWLGCLFFGFGCHESNFLFYFGFRV